MVRIVALEHLQEVRGLYEPVKGHDPAGGTLPLQEAAVPYLLDRAQDSLSAVLLQPGIELLTPDRVCSDRRDLSEPQRVPGLLTCLTASAPGPLAAEPSAFFCAEAT